MTAPSSPRLASRHRSIVGLWVGAAVAVLVILIVMALTGGLA
jgi:hypothetical protein